MDETGWRQEQRRAWLWTVVTAELTVFRIDRRRSGAVVEALLGADFAGVVGSDRWSAYSRFSADQRALCWAHLKRDFQGLVDHGGDLRTALPPDAIVPIGWVAVGDPAQILPPGDHERLWAIQEPLDFPGTVFGLERPAPGETLMPELTRRYSRACGRHVHDRII